MGYIGALGYFVVAFTVSLIIFKMLRLDNEKINKLFDIN